ncbi:MAG: hypothetical protein NZ733_06290 [Aigarchaeota archaeon]|nr:hypothetical protein [Aigarchaeota archaeon]MDW8041635.1 hypothetical protein [Nitrososphaerota archaeon]
MRWKSVYELCENDVRRLSYPNGDLRYGSEILLSLKSLGVEEVAVAADGGPFALGKGFRNVVFLVKARGEALAAKVRRDDWPFKEVWRETKVHRAANSVGVGPWLLGAERSVILMEFVDGVRLPDWVSVAAGDDLIAALKSLLYQCRALDVAGIDHGELGDPSKHVVVSRGGKVVIIDFGSARFTPRPKNVTAIASFISRGFLKERLLREGLVPEVDPLLLRRYKQTLSDTDFRAVLKAVGLE